MLELVTSYWLLVTSYWLQVKNKTQQTRFVAGGQGLNRRNRLQVTGYHLKTATGYWLKKLQTRHWEGKGACRSY